MARGDAVSERQYGKRAALDHIQREKPAPKSVRIAVITTGLAGAITCNCGWVKRHPRKTVREDAAQRHLDKKHFGQAMWI
jgi:hypothetical protein